MATPGTAQWSSRFAFIMAAVGSSVGLGNLWRFSAEAGSNGGGAFVIIYLICVLFIGIPVLMSEYLVGRAGQASSAVMSVEDLTVQSNVSKGWAGFAWIGMVAAFLIVSFYCVVAAWVLMYIPKFLFGAFEGLSPDQIASQFGTDAIGKNADGTAIWGSHLKVFGWFTVFAVFTAFLVSRGVNEGIEATAKFLMPLFFALLAGLSLYSLYTGFNTPITLNGEQTNGGAAALSFLFTPDWGKVNIDTIRGALGQAFFSIGIGSAIMITYGSYLPRSISIPRSSIFVALTDTAVAIIAGLAVFPIVFSHGLAVNSGAGLFFQTLPVALSNAPLIGAAFFFLAFFAAITSSISLFEPSVSYVVEKFNFSRVKSSIILGLLMWSIGAVCIISPAFFNFIDGKLTSTIMLPLSGLLLVLFVGWRLKKAIYDVEAAGVSKGMAALLYFLIRFVAPISIALILVFGVVETFLPNLYGTIMGLGTP